MVGVDVGSGQVHVQPMGQADGLIGLVLADTHGSRCSPGEQALGIDFQFGAENVRYAQFGRQRLD